MMENQKNRPSSYKKMSYMQKIASINAKRRMGDVKVIAERTGFGTSTVSEVLSGMYMNTRIVNKAYVRSRGRKSNQRVIAFG
jgi:predicted transcriptional regulator